MRCLELMVEREVVPEAAEQDASALEPASKVPKRNREIGP